DYIYVDCFKQTVENPAEVSRLISDRHFGVGGDGLILIMPSSVADVRMRMFNADGSESEMCGNGVRCVAKYAFEHGLNRANPIRVETQRGVLSLAMQIEAGMVQRVTVDMGAPILDSDLIPTRLKLPRVINQPLIHAETEPRDPRWHEKCGLDPRMTCASMGNPHLVLYCQRVDLVPLDEIGPILERHPMFPQRINVHFAQITSPSEVRMRTWERGSGITLACGTGACAVCVAGVLTSRTGRRILAHLPGGDLNLEWRESDNHVYKTGSATEVFSGEWISA
ncbi:MAG: diaminopimelate epimerase, partial [Tepidisphaeraceae bacterium]